MESVQYMIPYLINIFISMVLCFASQDKNIGSGYRKLFFILAILIPSIMAGMRYGIGTDYSNHYVWYNEIVSGSGISRDRIDIGFTILSKITGWLGIGFPATLFLLSFITSYSVLASLKKLENNVSVTFGYFTYLMLYYQMSYNIMRQICAAALFLYAITWLLEGNRKKSFIYMVIANSFHSSAIIGIPILLFNKIFVKDEYKITRRIIYVSSLVIVLTLPYIASLAVLLLEKIGRYVYYFKVGMEYQEIGFGLLRYILIVILPGFYFRKEIKNTNEIKIYYSVAILGFILWLTTYVSTNVIYRVSYNYLIVIVVLSAFFYKQIKIKNVYNRVLCKISLIAPILFFWVYDYFILGSDGTIPYVFIWSK